MGSKHNYYSNNERNLFRGKRRLYIILVIEKMRFLLVGESNN